MSFSDAGRGANSARGLVYAPLWRRIAAFIYDMFPVVALLMGATALWMIFSPDVNNAGFWFLRLFLLLIVGSYFVLSWVRGGQTLGMRAWKIQVRNLRGKPLNYQQASVRFLISIFSVGLLGLGVLWSLIDPHKRMWHDIAVSSLVAVK